ncbi:MAG: glycoside hydrolase family 9 protein, partial [Pontibacterium sp.]
MLKRILAALTALVSCNLFAAQITYIGAVATNVLAIDFQAGERIPAQQQKYERSLIGWIDDERDRHRWVRKGDKVLGSLVGPKDDTIYLFDGFKGQKLDTFWADRTPSYSISSTTDSAYSRQQQPIKVFRKSRPTDMARTGHWAFEWPLKHSIYLELPTALKEGHRYTITFNQSNFAPIEYTHNSRLNRSEAVHATQIGFRPDDPQKVAFLSLWRGNGGPQDYKRDAAFELIDTASGSPVYSGKMSVSRRGFDAEDVYNQNYSGTDVFIMNFSDFNGSGNFRVCVNGVGCSYDFPINKNVWQKAFVSSARGLYHQRNGIALTAPFTNFLRPRNMHPADGVTVLASRTPLMDTQNGINAKGTAKDNFAELIAGATNEKLPNAWGGYADAGDWDRRIQHLTVTRLLLELVELNPDYFKQVNLNIPESRNTLPDVLDEALWGLDFFRRMQLPNGGVSGGIESAEHPRHGEGSWQESQQLYAYAPGSWSSYEYAGVAARAARVFANYSQPVADIFAESAIRAMRWAEADYELRYSAKWPHHVRDARNLAAAELFRLTADEEWHAIFKATSVFHDPAAPLKKWQSHDQTDAAYVYLTSKNTASTLQQNAMKALLNEANQSVVTGRKTGFKWTKRNPWDWIGWGNITAPEAQVLIRAHALTQKPEYLSTVLLATQYGAGANPLNMVFTTGVGQNPVQNPLHQDHRVSGQPAPEGITVNGPLETKRQLNNWIVKLFNHTLYPRLEEWPTMEAYFDVYDFAALNEFTVQSTIAPNAYVWGYLAA